MNHAMVAAMPAAMLESQELGDILAQLLAADVTPAMIVELMDGHDAWVRDFLARKSLRLDTVADFDLLGSAGYSTRTETKKEVAQAKVDVEAMQLVQPPKDAKGRTLGTDDLERIRAAVAKTEAALLTLKKEQGAAEVSTPVEDVAEQRQALEAKLAETDDVLTTLEVHTSKARARFDAASNAVSEGKVVHSRAMNRVETAMRPLEQGKTALERLQTQKGACPTCGRAYTAKLRHDLLAPLEAALRQAETAYSAAVEAAQKQLEALPALHDEVSRTRQDIEEIETNHRRTESSRANVAAQLAALPKPSTARPLADVEADIEATIAKLERGRGLVSTLEQLREKGMAEAAIAHLEGELYHLDWAVSQFKDGAAIKGLVGDGLAEFTSRCNVYLKPHGHELTIAVNGKHVELQLQGRAARLASPGAKAVIQLAVALAFADSGAPVIVDDVNNMDGLRRRLALQQLREAQVGTVIAAASWQQTKNVDMVRLAAALAPATIVWMENGAAIMAEPAMAKA